MFRASGRGIVFLILAAFVVSGAEAHNSYLKAHVHFLATGTSVQSTIARSQDVYLVEMTVQAGGEPFLARLIDEYPFYEGPIDRAVLQSDHPAGFRVRRDSFCDREYRDMVLRTSPGDPLAILPERLGFAPTLPRAVDPGEMIPCYRIIHR